MRLVASKVCKQSCLLIVGACPTYCDFAPGKLFKAPTLKYFSVGYLPCTMVIYPLSSVSTITFNATRLTLMSYMSGIHLRTVLPPVMFSQRFLSFFSAFLNSLNTSSITFLERKLPLRDALKLWTIVFHSASNCRCHLTIIHTLVLYFYVGVVASLHSKFMFDDQRSRAFFTWHRPSRVHRLTTSSPQCCLPCQPVLVAQVL